MPRRELSTTLCKSVVERWVSPRHNLNIAAATRSTTLVTSVVDSCRRGDNYFSPRRDNFAAARNILRRGEVDTVAKQFFKKLSRRGEWGISPRRDVPTTVIISVVGTPRRGEDICSPRRGFLGFHYKRPFSVFFSFFPIPTHETTIFGRISPVFFFQNPSPRPRRPKISPSPCPRRQVSLALSSPSFFSRRVLVVLPLAPLSLSLSLSLSCRLIVRYDFKSFLRCILI